MQKMKVNSEGSARSGEVRARQTAWQRVAACFLPTQHHEEGLRGGCVQAINPCCRRRLLLVAQTKAE